MQEKRKHPRVKLDHHWAVRDRDQDALLGHLVDISLGGVMIFTNLALERGRIFQLCLRPDREEDGEAFCIGVETLWREPSHDPEKYWVGLQIIDISPESLERIGDLVERQG